jgi:hypothetical protein
MAADHVFAETVCRVGLEERELEILNIQTKSEMAWFGEWILNWMAEATTCGPAQRTE